MKKFALLIWTAAMLCGAIYLIHCWDPEPLYDITVLEEMLSQVE